MSALGAINSRRASASDRASALGLAALLAVAAVGHFRKPEMFDPTIPAVLPGRPRDWVIGSGIVEAATAVVIAAPPTRRLGGLMAATLFVVVFPANLTMARDGWRTRADRPGYAAGMLARLPIQIPLVLWALRVRRTAWRRPTRGQVS